jgi:hypothetical protein
MTAFLRWGFLALVGMTLLLPINAAAEDRILVFFSGERHGGSASFLWTNRHLVSLGVSHHRFSGTEWSYVTAGHVRALGRAKVLFEVNVGRGKGMDAFDYSILRLNAVGEVVPRQFYVELEDRYIDVDRQAGNLIRGGATWFPSDRLSLSASVYESISGNLGARYVAGRTDWNVGSRTISAGAAFGRSEPVLFQRIQPLPPNTSVREIFGGIAFPARLGRTTLMLSTLRVGGEDRHRVIVGWAYPY